ncbi:MAG: hypothetical protein J5527_15125 [Treponema sp.]|nr:hypothetical protein [Treponema sp.]
MKRFKLLFVVFFLAFSLNAQVKPIVQDIFAQAGNGPRINVYWTLPKNVRPAITKLLLYRATQPITSYSQIERMLPIAELSPETTGYTDTISDFNDYYYAVIVCNDRPYDLIMISMNATVTGAHLTAVVPEKKQYNYEEPEKLYLDGEKRKTPLPYIDYVEGLNNEQQISEYTAKSTTQFYSSSQNNYNEITPYFFEEDLISPDGGDDFILFEILKTTFVQEKYEEAVVELKRLTNLNISKAVQNRTYFYMAEAQFFIGQYDEAVKNFINASSAYPQLTKKWINLSLDKLKVPE